MSSDMALELSRICIAVSFSRMLPSESDKVAKIRSSVSLSIRRLLALVIMSSCLASSSSGLGELRENKSHRKWYNMFTFL